MLGSSLTSRAQAGTHFLRDMTSAEESFPDLLAVGSLADYYCAKKSASFPLPSITLRQFLDECAGFGIEDDDLAVTANPKPPPRTQNIMVIDDPLVLVCGRGHALWRRRYVRSKDLDGQKLVTFDDQSPTAKVIERVLSRHKIEMDAIIKTPQIAALVRMVRMNMGLAFLPQLALQHELESGGLHALQFASEELHRGIWLSWKEPEEFPARDAFVECMQEVAEAKARSVAI